MSRECHDQKRGCLHYEEDHEAPHVRMPRKKRRARKHTCRAMKLGGAVVRVRGRHPMGKRDLAALDALVRAALRMERA